MSNRFPYTGAIPEKGVASPYYVMIAMPVGDKVCASTTVALTATAQSLSLANVRFDIEVLQGCCHVDDARNILIRNFLQSDATDLFFVDADLGWQPNNVLRLLKLPGDIVCGVYIHKSDAETYPFHPFEGETRVNKWGLFDMPKAATGFMRIRRHVLEALYEREKAKDRLMWLDGDSVERNRLPVARICERGFVRELGLEHLSRTHASQSGDYVLCLKARSLGFTVFVDPDMAFTHTGEKTWNGHFGEDCRRRQKIDKPKFEEAVQAIAECPQSVSVFDQLVSSSLYNPRSGLPGAALRACYNMALEAEGDILECGSGLSTLVMGLALKGSSHKLYTLENDLDWVERVQIWLERYGAENVNLIYAPLHPAEGGRWYGVGPDDLPGTFDGVLIDGPARTGVNRYTVFKVLGEAIKGARTWIIDDMEDPIQLTMLTDHGANRQTRMIVAEAAGFRHDTVIAIREDADATKEAAE